MSQLVLDDHPRVVGVQERIRRWSTIRFLRDIYPVEVIKDERVPSLLRALRRPTFVTIDSQFRDRTLCDRRYCILYFALRTDEQGEIPALLRRLLRLPQFRTRAARMGKVARVSRDRVSWWQLGGLNEQTVHWRRPSRGGSRR